VIAVDTRFTGYHGIARYAREVTGRLTVPWTALPGSRNPASVQGMLDGWKLPPGTRMVYSPGFNVVATKAPQVVTIHDLIHLRGSGPRPLAYRAYYESVIKPRIRSAGTVLTVSHTSAIELRKWLGRSSVEIINAGNGCSPVFAPTGKAHTADRPYFLYVGNTRRHKNVDVILHALARVPEAELLVVSAEAGGFTRLFHAAGVAGRATVLSSVPDPYLAELYRGAVATLFPSTREGFGLPAVESLSCGTPVLYWRGCASVHEICDGYGLALREANDPAEWTRLMRGLLRRAPGHVDFDIARYSWNRVAVTVSEVLDAYRC